MHCRVKICGITNIEDALMACEYDADALGFVFYQKSPRYISPEKANEIVARLPPFVVPVALFVNASKEEIDQVLQGSCRWVIQFHGNELDGECVQYKRSFIKALRVKEDENISLLVQQYPSASAILLDTYKAGVPGGTGEAFNWELIPENLTKPLILAGGLTPDNVRSAVQQVSPYAVDVSGGVEREKGLKSRVKTQEFIIGAKRG